MHVLEDVHGLAFVFVFLKLVRTESDITIAWVGMLWC